MSDDGERYQVAYFRNDEEVLTAPESYDLAHVTARVLQGWGHRVGKIMSENAALDYMRAKYGRTPEIVNPYTAEQKTYRGIPVPDRVQRDQTEDGRYAAWREGVDAALDAAADEIVRETRNSTGGPGASEVWDLLNRHAAKLADHLRNMSGEER